MGKAQLAARIPNNSTKAFFQHFGEAKQRWDGLPNAELLIAQLKPRLPATTGPYPKPRLLVSSSSPKRPWRRKSRTMPRDRRCYPTAVQRRTCTRGFRGGNHQNGGPIRDCNLDKRRCKVLSLRLDSTAIPKFTASRRPRRPRRPPPAPSSAAPAPWPTAPAPTPAPTPPAVRPALHEAESHYLLNRKRFDFTST